MDTFLIFIHALCCLLLVAVVLMQSGRAGGLTDFASAENVFGARTSEVMVRATVVLAGVFLVTSLSLAYLSARSERSLIPEERTVTKPMRIEIPVAVNAVMPAGSGRIPAGAVEAPLSETPAPAGNAEAPGRP